MEFIKNVLRRRPHLPHCDGCGEVRVIHPLEKLLSWLEERSGKYVSMRVVPKYKKNSKLFFRIAQLLSSVRIATLHADAKHTIDSRVHAVFEGASEARLHLTEVCFFGLHSRFILEDASGHVLSFKYLPHELLPYSSPIYIDDKYELIQLLGSHGLQVPKSWSVTKHTTIDELPKPSEDNAFVVKPRIGTRGRHTTLHITTVDTLRQALSSAFTISTRALVQEELKGTVFRCTAVSGTHVYVARREYPSVIGDGVHTVDELVAMENKSPIRDGVYFRKIVFGDYEKNLLVQRGISSSYVVPLGEKCVVSDKNSRRNGTLAEDVTEEVHQDIHAYIQKCARILKSPVLGFDFICVDHCRELSSQQYGVIECNSVPYIDVHHRVSQGKSHNIAAELFSLVIHEYDLQPHT